MQKTWKPTTAGILAIIAGAFQVIMGIAIAVVGGIGGAFLGMGWLGAIGAPLIVLGIVAIVGGIYALRRKIWGLALAGCICALVGPWFLGIPAIIFVCMGKGEFE
jgi:ABC-type Co2+ transport system permease subunit